MMMPRRWRNHERVCWRNAERDWLIESVRQTGSLVILEILEWHLGFPRDQHEYVNDETEQHARVAPHAPTDVPNTCITASACQSWLVHNHSQYHYEPASQCHRHLLPVANLMTDSEKGTTIPSSSFRVTIILYRLVSKIFACDAQRDRQMDRQTTRTITIWRAS